MVDGRDKRVEIPNFLRGAGDSLEELGKFVTNVETGLRLLSSESPLWALFRDLEIGLDEPAIGEFQAFSSGELSQDAPYVYSLGTVRLVTLLESVVTDAAVEALVRFPATREREVVQKLEGPLVKFAAASIIEQAEYLFERLTEVTRAKLKAGVGRYEAVLDAVGLGGGVDDLVRRTLYEMLEVRNVLIHRNGRVDDRLIKNCAELGVNIGDRLAVTRQMFFRYLAAIQYYVIEITDRWFSLAGRVPLTTSRQFKERYLSRISELSNDSSSA